MKKMLFLSLAALAVSAAHAQNYAGVEFGSATTDIEGEAGSQAQYLANLTRQTVFFEIDDSTTNVRFFGGQKFSEQTKFELGYFSTGDIKVNYRGMFFGEASTKASASGFDASVIHDPFLNGFFLKAGLHSSKISVVYTQSAGGFSETASSSASGVGILYGLGYEKQISEGLNLRGSFVFYNNLAGDSNEMTSLTVGLSKNF